MAPIKFEETIKDKLEKRTLQPSSAAWDELSAQLNSEDKKSRRNLFFYIGIAASIVGVLLVTTLFFKSSEEQTLMPTVVEVQQENQDDITNKKASETIIVTSNTDQIQKEDNIKDSKHQQESSIINEQNVAAIYKENQADQSIKNNTSNSIETKSKVVAVNTSVEKQKEVKLLNELTFEEAKAIEVVAHIKKLETEKGSVSDAEIEDLLKQAEREILRQRIYNETTRTVDADALLQDVEDDLERSFRTRVFETLRSSYKTVKTAVAERNN